MSFFTSMHCKLWAAEYERTKLPLIMSFNENKQ